MRFESIFNHRFLTKSKVEGTERGRECRVLEHNLFEMPFFRQRTRISGLFMVILKPLSRCNVAQQIHISSSVQISVLTEARTCCSVPRAARLRVSLSLCSLVGATCRRCQVFSPQSLFHLIRPTSMRGLKLVLIVWVERQRPAVTHGAFNRRRLKPSRVSGGTQCTIFFINVVTLSFTDIKSEVLNTWLHCLYKHAI